VSACGATAHGLQPTVRTVLGGDAESLYAVHGVRKGQALGAVRLEVRAGEVVVGLVSLVSVWGRNWCYLCGTVERVAVCETVEIANIHPVLVHVAENMVGFPKAAR
jgi:hypothetical protein